MQSAFTSVFGGLDPFVTSIMHGEHKWDAQGRPVSAHHFGRAIDVGAFGGTAIGVNQPTVAALVRAIVSGRFEKIGTLKALIDSPALQRLAAMYHTELFQDDEQTGASGPHVHFQVAA